MDLLRVRVNSLTTPIVPSIRTSSWDPQVPQLATEKPWKIRLSDLQYTTLSTSCWPEGPSLAQVRPKPVTRVSSTSWAEEASTKSVLNRLWRQTEAVTCLQRLSMQSGTPSKVPRKHSKNVRQWMNSPRQEGGLTPTRTIPLLTVMAWEVPLTHSSTQQPYTQTSEFYTKTTLLITLNATKRVRTDQKTSHSTTSTREQTTNSKNLTSWIKSRPSKLPKM